MTIFDSVIVAQTTISCLLFTKSENFVVFRMQLPSQMKRICSQFFRRDLFLYVLSFQLRLNYFSQLLTSRFLAKLLYGFLYGVSLDYRNPLARNSVLLRGYPYN
jgi:hypothetical protein